MSKTGAELSKCGSERQHGSDFLALNISEVDAGRRREFAKTARWGGALKNRYQSVLYWIERRKRFSGQQRCCAQAHALPK